MTDRTDGSTGEYPTGESGDQQVSPPVGPPSPPVPYGAPAPHGAAAPYTVGAVAPRTNTLAIVSLVTGFCCSIAAVVTGHIALGQIKRTGEAGRGLAIAGLVLGYASIAITTLLLILALVFAAAVSAFVASVNGATSSSTYTATPVPAPSGETSGQTGAAYFDEGYLQVGTGTTVVDLYIDPMCPFCGQFDLANGDTLAGLVEDGSITLRLYSLTFLDPTSQGTEYSTRASAALTCEAALNPESTLDYLSALFVNQPTEGTTGLSDDELVALSSGSESISECVSSERYQAWSQQNTDLAVSGGIQGTPTLLVDGSRYTGPIDDPQAVADFILGATL
ncbi:DUF4190 domain-containing protein [Cryobacterium sp. W22_MBD10_FK3]|uniref:DUF4190 domain-containing protein n=1 Tax=Cryobacterium sp. W22_MBD10_FK3 TaxID=3240273 RepID=UPI003F916765